MPKKELEFHSIDDIEWQQVTEGIVKGRAWVKILSKDESTGVYTRLYRLEAGTETEGVLTHDCWEEVYVLQGGLIDRGKNNLRISTGMYACRPPRMKHGPYSAPVGFLGFEVRYRSN